MHAIIDTSNNEQAVSIEDLFLCLSETPYPDMSSYVHLRLIPRELLNSRKTTPSLIAIVVLLPVPKRYISV